MTTRSRKHRWWPKDQLPGDHIANLMLLALTLACGYFLLTTGHI